MFKLRCLSNRSVEGDDHAARRQGIRKPAGRGAIALREKSGRNAQAKHHGKVGSAQGRAEEIAL